MSQFWNWLIAIIIFQIILIINCRSPKCSSKNNVRYSYKKISLTINNKVFQVELADTPEKRMYGLMDREFLNEDEGMLFVFETSGVYPFWMKNTKIPLSIAFINDKGVITEIFEMIPLEDKINYVPSVPIRYALEMNQGWFFKNNIKVGDIINGLPE